MNDNSIRLQAGLRTTKQVLLGLLLLLFVVVALFPFLYMLVISFISDGRTLRLTQEYLSQVKWTLDNYSRVLITGNFAKYLLNSAIVSIISCIATCALSSAAAYAFAKKGFRGASAIFMIYLATMMVPTQVTMIPLYLQMRKMGLINTYIGMCIPFACGAFGTILITSFMKGVPDELLEAAEIDGCGEFRKFVSVAIPLIKPALISLTIFTFVSTWGALIWPMLMATNNSMTTSTVAISMMKNDFAATNYGFTMAGTTICFLPPIILYCILQKEFVEGIALSGTKG